MKILHIAQTKKFQKQWAALPMDIQNRTRVCTKKFRDNPFHPSLRLHPLSGKLNGFWSISITLNHRIIFEVIEDTALFHSIGNHSIYEKM